jgi:hypothetical protein
MGEKTKFSRKNNIKKENFLLTLRYFSVTITQCDCKITLLCVAAAILAVEHY